MQEQVSLTIEGNRGQEVQVWYRGNPSNVTDDPAPIVYTGKLVRRYHSTRKTLQAGLIEPPTLR